MGEDDCFTPCASELETAPKIRSQKPAEPTEIKTKTKGEEEKTRFKQKLPVVV